MLRAGNPHLVLSDDLELDTLTSLHEYISVFSYLFVVRVIISLLKIYVMAGKSSWWYYIFLRY